jgi:hypothetical protein
METRIVGPMSQVLELNSTIAGRIWDVDHGYRSPVTVEESIGPSARKTKQIAVIQRPTSAFTFGAGMISAFYKWLKQTWDHAYAKKDLAIIGFSDVKRLVQRCELSNTLVTEITLPALDASAKNAAGIDLKVLAEQGKTSSSTVPQPPSRIYKMGVHAMGTAKLWQTSDFRLSIQGLEQACSKVSRVSAFQMKQSTNMENTGVTKRPEILPTDTEFSDLEIAVPLNAGGDFLKLAETTAIRGGIDSGKRQSGYLEYLGPDKKPYFRLDFGEIYFKSVEVPKEKGNSLVKLNIAVEYVSFSFDGRACVG